jgi:ADP-ribosylglycohydrolase
MDRLTDKIYGCLLGGLIGDAMGAPVEGKTYQQIAERYGEAGVTDFEGSGTDDTAIRIQLISAIFASGGYPTVDHFARTFVETRARNLRLWYVPVKNAFHKIEGGLVLPAYAGWGNQQSSSSAMIISPMGILNACHPRQAALETLHVASFIHNGPSGFCRDAAAAMAAAAAAAFTPGATVDTVVEATTAYLMPDSAVEMRGQIEGALALVEEAGSYARFRALYYERHLRQIISDSRETVPAVIAIFQMAGGDPRQAILWGANFGRDADTIGTMVGGLVGALHGSSGLPGEWVAKVEANAAVDHRDTASRLAEIVRQRAADARTVCDVVQGLV